MERGPLEVLVTVVTGVLAVAMLAVLVSPKAQTGSVLAAFGSAFSNMLSAATGPVTGSVAAPVNNIGNSGFGIPSLNMPTSFG